MKPRHVFALAAWCLLLLAVARYATAQEYPASSVVYGDGATLEADGCRVSTGNCGGGSSFTGLPGNAVTFDALGDPTDAGFPALQCTELSDLSDVTGPILGTSNRLRFSLGLIAAGNAVTVDASGNLADSGTVPGGGGSALGFVSLDDPTAISQAQLDANRGFGINLTTAPAVLDLTLPAPTNNAVRDVVFFNDSATAGSPATYNNRRLSINGLLDIWSGQTVSLLFDGSGWREVAHSYSPFPLLTYGCGAQLAGTCASPMAVNPNDNSLYVVDTVAGGVEQGIYFANRLPAALRMKEGAPGTFVSAFCDNLNSTATQLWSVVFRYWIQWGPADFGTSLPTLAETASAAVEISMGESAAELADVGLRVGGTLDLADGATVEVFTVTSLVGNGPSVIGITPAAAATFPAGSSVTATSFGLTTETLPLYVGQVQESAEADWTDGVLDAPYTNYAQLDASAAQPETEVYSPQTRAGHAPGEGSETIDLLPFETAPYAFDLTDGQCLVAMGYLLGGTGSVPASVRHFEGEFLRRD